MQIHLYTYDLPDDVLNDGAIALDTETMGLQVHRDRLCLLQLSFGDGSCYLVHFPEPKYDCSPNVCRLLNDNKRLKIFHYGRFDIAVLKKTFNVRIRNVYCTKIASKLARTFTDRHSLKSLCKDLLNVDIVKHEQCSYWGADTLTPEQLNYASTDVLYLHILRDMLNALLIRESKMELAQACFDFLPYRAELDVLANDFDIFGHGC
ncbi:MAG: ribonuclease H-like domain-containing protein [Holosporales bacterium]|jgi:ribonuclease D|nr:ribonuclease H-like domain-containing protein [Holosporales bacterium]